MAEAGKQDVDSGLDTTVTLPPAPREDLISTAIKFLQNPKVIGSPLAAKKTFLKNKGLTSDEIDLAISRCGVPVDGSTGSPPGGGNTYQQHAVQTYQAPPPVPVSPWAKARDFTALAIIISGVSYGVFNLIKKYLLPYLGKPDAEERRLAKIDRSVQELQTSMSQTVEKLQETMSSVKELLEKQGKTLEEITNSSATRRKGDNSDVRLDSIKDELKTLKGLLLSRKQFPQAPTTTPILPAWQLAETPKGGATSSEGSTSQKVSPGALSWQQEDSSENEGSVGEKTELASQSKESFTMIESNEKIFESSSTEIVNGTGVEEEKEEDEERMEFSVAPPSEVNGETTREKIVMHGASPARKTAKEEEEEEERIQNHSSRESSEDIENANTVITNGATIT